MTQPDENPPEDVNWLQAQIERMEADQADADAEARAFTRALFHPTTEETS